MNERLFRAGGELVTQAIETGRKMQKAANRPMADNVIWAETFLELMKAMKALERECGIYRSGWIPGPSEAVYETLSHPLVYKPVVSWYGSGHRGRTPGSQRGNGRAA